MRRFRRRLSAFLSFLVLLSTLLPVVLYVEPKEAYAVTATGMSETKCAELYDTYNYKAPPPNVHKCNVQGMFFNYKLFQDLGIIAYAPSSSNIIPISSVLGDFKSGWQDPNPPYTQHPSTYTSGTHPYFHVNGEDGEYRYLGYDYLGRPYDNPYFIDDKNGASPMERKWIFRPWESLLVTGYNKPSGQSKILPTFPEIDFYSPETIKNLNSIIRTDPIPYIKYSNNISGQPNNLYNFMYVEQDPSSWVSGYGTMWSLGKNNKVWYQTFEIPQLNQKQMSPVDVKIDILDKRVTDQYLDFGKFPEKVIKLRVKVTGLLNDDPVYVYDASLDYKVPDRYLKAVYWFREDIRDWKIQLNAPSNNLSKSNIQRKYNSGEAEFTLLIEKDGYKAGDKIDLSGIATSNFSPTKFSTGNNMKSLIVKDGTTGSKFTLKPGFTFCDTSQFTSAAVGYHDASDGDIKQYQIDVTNISNNQKQTRTYSASKDTLNSSQVNGDIFNFMKQFFPVSGEVKSISFDIKQTIATKSGKTYSSNTTYTIKENICGPPPSDGQTDNYLSEPPEIIECSPNIPQNAFDIVPFPASDGTDMNNVAERHVYVDGTEVDSNAFFFGGYVFGDDKDGIREVRTEYKGFKGAVCTASSWVTVWDTKPNAKFNLDLGKSKQNRKFKADDDSMNPNVNYSYVTAAYPILEREWIFGSSTKWGTDNTSLHKEFLYKNTGVVTISLRVKNALGRWSDPYDVTFEVLPDEDPGLVLHPWNSSIARGGNVSLLYNAQSVDGDNISKQEFKVYYDSDNNGTYDQLIDTISGPVTSYIPPNKLGKYKIVGYAEESFGEETIPQYITSADTRSSTSETWFEVDNYIPYADIYSDIPNVRPDVDLYFMLDKNLPRSKNDYIKQHEMDINNQMRGEGINPQVYSWDMYTYVTPASASTSYHTGSSYPPSTYYYVSGAYSGTLNRTSVSNAPYSVDQGYYVTTTSYQDAYGYCNNTTGISGGKSFGNSSYCSNLYSGGYPYSSNGYVGNLPYQSTSKTCDYYPTVGTKTGDYSCYYTNTYYSRLSKSTQTWQPNIVWYNDYTGYYSGTVYRYDREPYVQPFTRTASTKYIVYFSDDIINEIADFNTVKSQSDAKIILVGNNNIKTQASYDYFIPNTGQTAQNIVDDIVKYIASSNPVIPATYVLLNQPFQLYTLNSDDEGDPIVQQQTMYIQDANFFDNSQGKASYAVSAFDDAAWQSQQLRTSFDKVGKYEIYRRIKDNPSVDPNFAEYSYYSNNARINVIVHRKPIALATLDWDYDASANTYKTTWVDQSYDLDHNVSDPVNRGILDRKIRFKKLGGDWQYRIPATLDAGSYTLEYTVKDQEFTWSDPFVITFTLASAPPVQLEAKARTELSRFTLTSIPASEDLRMYDIWTRYPYSLYLDIALYHGGVKKTTSRIVPYYNGVKDDNDITWSDVIYNIPSTLPDGNYVFRITGAGQNGISAYKDFPTTVNTPVNLAPTFPSEIVVGDNAAISASTSKYADTVQVTLFKGTLYQTTITIPAGTVNGFGKDWSKSVVTPNIPDGTYNVEYRASTPNGNVETKMLQTHVVHNRPPAASFDWSPKPVWEGDKVTFINQSTDPDGDSLTAFWEITRPDGTKLTSASYNPTITFVQIGNYSVKLTVSDGKASNSVTNNIWASELTIQSQVDHTAEWFLYHQKNKHEVTIDPKDFYSGELFIVKTVTSDAPVNKVTAWIETTGIDGKHLKVSVLLSVDGMPSRFKGELFDQRFLSMTQGLPKGIQQIQFEVQYSNGVVKRETVPVNIIGNVNQAVGVHRRQ